MAFRVEFTRRAETDLDSHLAWWSRHGRAAAAQWRIRFLIKVIAALEADPHRYPQADEAAKLGIDLRLLLYGRRRQVYRVLFTIEDQQVIVHRVRHAAQQELEPGDV